MAPCPSCGYQNADDAKFCENCGTQLSAQETKQHQTGSHRMLANRYELVRELGRGAMGVVYLARDRVLDGREVAVKILPKELASDPRALVRLKREATTAMEITHPNVVRLHTFEEYGEDHFLVMEYIDGSDLLHVLADAPGGRFDVDTFLRYADEICTGVAYAHHENVVHSDLKPANIMLTAEDEVKITDFGVAQVVHETMTRVSRVETAGTLLYMSPEILGGERNSMLSDQYALGITFYEMLTGNPPFVRGDITDQHKNKPVPPIPGVPEHINTAILRALAKHPEDRWPDVEAFAGALQGEPTVGWEEQKTVVIRSETRSEKSEEPDDNWWAAETVVRSAPKKNGSGRLFVTSQPADATVFIDGMEMGKAGTLINDIPEGERSVRLSLPEYADLTKTVTIEANSITRTGELVLERAKATVNIISEPLDAQIIFDEQFAGRTPNTLREVPPGTYSIHLTKPGYLEIEEQVDIAAPVTDLEYELEGGAVEFRGKWVKTELRDSVLAAEEKKRKAIEEQETQLAKKRRKWILMVFGLLLCAVVVFSWKLNHSLKIAGMKRQITSAMDGGDFDHAASVAQQLIAYDAEAGERYPERVRTRREERISELTGNINSAIAIQQFNDAAGFVGRLRVIHADSAEVYRQRIESARQQQAAREQIVRQQRSVRAQAAAARQQRQRAATLVDELRSAWQYRNVQERDRALRQLRSLDPDNAAIARYSGIVPGTCVRTVTGYSTSVLSVAAAGNRIVSGSADNEIRVLDLATGNLVRTITGHSSRISAIACAGDRIVSGSAYPENAIKVWDLNTGQIIRTITGHSGPVHSVAVSGDVIVSGSTDRTIKVWDLNTGRIIRTITGHTGPVNSVAVAGNRIVSGSSDNTVKIWDMTTGRLIRTLQEHTNPVTSVAVTGNIVVSGSRDRNVKIWSMETGRRIRTLYGHAGDITSVAVTEDVIVSGSKDRTVKVWNPSTGQLMAALTGHTADVNSVAVTGDRIVSGSKDRSIRIWSMPR